jgi:ribonuclease P protein component
LLALPVAGGTGRIGYVIGRRQLSRAVDRNRLRRLWREAVRARGPLTRGFDIVVRLRDTCFRADVPGVATEAASLLDSLATAVAR